MEKEKGYRKKEAVRVRLLRMEICRRGRGAHGSEEMRDVRLI
jgi:hypothetical protein